MKCAELQMALQAIPLCSDTEEGARVLTHCLYPSADPVIVYVARIAAGFRVTDGGAAVRSALVHGRSVDPYLDVACKKFAVSLRGGALVAEFASIEWVPAAVIAVANASATAARLAVEASAPRAESALRDAIYESLKRAVSPSKIGTNYDYRGRSGHIWQVDFAVTSAELILIKGVVQNGNSINSNYATFGDIGDDEPVEKFSVYDNPLAQDASSLLRQVATIVPVQSLASMVQQHESPRSRH